MSELKQGRVRVELPDSVKLSERAGKMSKKEVSRLLKAPLGMKRVSEFCALALEDLGSSFLAPAGVTPESLRASGATESEVLESTIHDLSCLLLTLKQGKLLIDHQQHLQLLKLKDQVRAQAKYDAGLKRGFAPLLELFEKSAETRKENLARVRREARERSSPPQEASASVSERPALTLVNVPEVAG